METFRAVLLNVWREACRHIEIGESTEMIAAMLTRDMPVDCVLVLRFDEDRGVLETVAAAPAAGIQPAFTARSQCSPQQRERLAAWAIQRRVFRPGSDESLEGVLQCLLPAEADRDVLVGPLGWDALAGLVLFLASAGQAFTARHESLAQVLLEPFSAALENDRRLRETNALREAAEADKQSLLAKLGRKELGDTIVGGDTGLRGVMERVELVARSDVPVLIFGETGTGKELVARALHTRSPREDGPFHRVNCGAIPADLIDSELFGHEKGAFTGAAGTRKGWFERADGGTLFLDEIGELPPAAQVRLLRILQDGWLERVGGHQPIHVDVRVVAATHRDLARMVAEGGFREDLWYRIAVFPVVLPPLRERREDVPALARHFARRAATRFGLTEAMPTPEDIDLLQSYSWPGNIRELAAVIDRAAILGEGGCLEVAKALGTSARPSERPSRDAHPTTLGNGSISEITPLDAAMRGHIELALAAVAGRIEGPGGAARLLQINPHTLRARMRKLGVDWKAFRQ